jgi:hypothetical protein
MHEKRPSPHVSARLRLPPCPRTWQAKPSRAAPLESNSSIGIPHYQAVDTARQASAKGHERQVIDRA